MVVRGFAMSNRDDWDLIDAGTDAHIFKILLVDDSQFVRTQVRDILLSQKVTLLEAEDGEAALEVLAKHQDIKLILCDVNMPRMDGLAFLKKLLDGQGAGKAKIPVIMLTTENSLDKVILGKKLGAIAWIIKPLMAPDIIRLIDKFKPT
jgi:two-component system, chemotaxis family, chemotaxis protein CheY